MEHPDTIDHPATAELSSSASDGTPAPAPLPGPTVEVGSQAPPPLADENQTAVVDAPPVPPDGPATRRIPLRRRFHTVDSLRYRDFRLLWTANLSLSGGAWLQDLVVGWLTYNQTRSPLLTAMAVGLVALPYLFAAPLGGVVADLWDRRKLIVTACIYQALVTGGFASLIILDVLQTWHIFAYILALGASWAMSDPARVAAVLDVVPRRNLVNAFALNALAFNSTRLVVPTVAGLMLVWVGPGRTLLLGTALYLAGALTAMGMRLTPSQGRDGSPSTAVTKLVEAARYVLSEPLVLLVLGLGVLQLLIVMPFVHGLLPVYASEVFRMGPAGLGLMMSAVGAGAVLGAIALATLGEVARKGRFLVVAVSLNALAMIALSRSGTALPPIPVLLVLGAGMGIQFSIGGAFVLGMTPGYLRGRVAALSMMTFGLFPVGALLSGGLAEVLDAPSATLIGAGALIATLAVLRRHLVRLWLLDDGADDEPTFLAAQSEAAVGGASGEIPQRSSGDEPEPAD